MAWGTDGFYPGLSEFSDYFMEYAVTFFVIHSEVAYGNFLQILLVEGSD